MRRKTLTAGENFTSKKFLGFLTPNKKLGSSLKKQKRGKKGK